MQLADAMCLIDRIAKVLAVVETAATPDGWLNFQFGFTGGTLKDTNLNIAETRRSLEGLVHGVTPPAMLSLALEGVMNFFYPPTRTSDSKIES